MNYNLHSISLVVGLGALFSPTFVYATSANIPLTINIRDANPNLLPIRVNSAEIYLNTTDSHYHVRGTVTNMLHETKDISSVNGLFTNKSTGSLLGSAMQGPIITHLGPGKTIGYDIDTGYTSAQLAQFKSMKLDVNAS
jgi:hypothetical protein